MSKIRMLLFIAALFCICTPLTEDTGNDDDEGPTLFFLSLEESGRKSAEFSGAPIKVLIELDQDTLFEVLQWHTGQGDPVFSDSLLTKKAREFSLFLTWKKYPLVKDSATGDCYDTVYVSVGGGLKKSNRVIVKVSNLPVVVDSAVFNAKQFAGTDSVWRYHFGDTVKVAARYTLKFYVRDLDAKSLSLQVLTKKGTVLRQSSVASDMVYEPPSGDFVDTLSFIAYDQRGSQIVRRLIITKTSPNKAPVIDSIQIESVVLRGTQPPRVAFAAMDTLKLQVFAHDNDGTIKNVRWRSPYYTISADSSDAKKARWICTTKECSDTVEDTSYIIDSIFVKVFDDRGDSAGKYVVVYNGGAEKPPVISRVTAGDKVLGFTDSIARVSLVGGEACTVLVSAYDPEKKTLRTSFKGYPASRVKTLTDSTALYTAPALRDSDTIAVSVADEFATINRFIIITITDVGPRLDSIYVKDTVFKGSDTGLVRMVGERDTVSFVAYAADKDKEDTLTFTWSAIKESRFISKTTNRAKYLLPATDLSDTITLTLQDGAVQAVKKILLLPENRLPVVDSITGNGNKLQLSAVVNYTCKVNAADTVDFKLFVRDPDGDSLAITWSVKDSSKLIMAEGDSATYLSDDSSGKDTISVSISDEFNPVMQRNIIVQTETAVTK